MAEGDQPSLSFVDLTSVPAGRAEYVGLYEAVLRPAFSSEELSPDDQGWPGYAPEGLVLGVKADGQWVGASVTRFGPGPVGCLAYLATSAASRGMGIGSKLLTELRGRWAGSNVDVVLAELHDPRVWDDTDDEHPTARLRFYERQGSRVLNVPWVQPAVAPGAGRVHGMLLATVYERDPNSQAFPAGMLKDWMREQSRIGEGLANPAADETCSRICGRIGDESVEILSMSDFRRVKRGGL